ncbi:MAG TPA: hypothetical protein DEO94_00980 [Cyanobacteria bacterium UBA11991]|nr:hypothetical protein [Cyanobacteria bacterium UBA11991]
MIAQAEKPEQSHEPRKGRKSDNYVKMKITQAGRARVDEGSIIPPLFQIYVLFGKYAQPTF